MKPRQIRCLEVGNMFGDKLPFTKGKVYDITNYWTDDAKTGRLRVTTDHNGGCYISLNSEYDGEWRYIHPSFKHKTTDY